MKVLVAGADGMLAADLQRRLAARGHEVVGLPKRELDITNAASIARAVGRVEPEVIYNCAAYNLVDQAESEPELAQAVNGDGVRNLCLACRERGVLLVHFSTDYVFDGEKDGPYAIDDRPNPINSYGRSKLSGERSVLELLSEFFLVRTSWLFGLHGKNFVEAILARARERGELAVVDGERGCPTWTVDLATAVIDLVATRQHGIYHVTNAEPTTRYAFAAEILQRSGLDTPLRRTSPGELGLPARRPPNSVLDSKPLTQVLGRELPSWKRALDEYLQLRAAQRQERDPRSAV